GDWMAAVGDLRRRDSASLRERGLHEGAERRLADALRRLASRSRDAGEARSLARRAIALEPLSPKSYAGLFRVGKRAKLRIAAVLVAIGAALCAGEVLARLLRPEQVTKLRA